MNVLISGSTGLIGSAVADVLRADGDEVVGLSRSSPRVSQRTIQWDPESGKIDAAALSGFDAVVHLAGESIAARRWTARQKQRILDSRVRGTRLLCETLARLETRPRTLIAASAIGYYGDRGDEILDEQSDSGSNFLADVCRQWEAATEPAAKAGIRVVNIRFGVVLSPKGGALAKMLTPFRLGFGGRIGSGKQWMSWIALDDVAMIVGFALATDALSGPVNVVTENPVSNHEFTKTLGGVLRRPTVFPMPALAARLAFGQLADELLLASTRVLPLKLTDAGYTFRYPHLEPALRHLLGTVS